MNEKKSSNIIALILSIVVCAAAMFGVKFAGGSVVPAGPDVDPDETVAEQSGPKAGDYTASAKGYDGGEVIVTITIDETGAITACTINADSQTPALGGAAAKKLEKKIVENQGEVDIVTSATYTSEAIIEALADCMAQSESGSGATAGDAYTGGTYTATAKGYDGGDVIVTITLDASKTITECTIDASSQTAALGGAAATKLEKKIVEKQGDVDVVTSATYTSEAIIEALKDCLAQAGK